MCLHVLSTATLFIFNSPLHINYQYCVNIIFGRLNFRLCIIVYIMQCNYFVCNKTLFKGVHKACMEGEEGMNGENRGRFLVHAEILLHFRGMLASSKMGW